MVCAELMRSIASKPARCRALDPSSGRTFTNPKSDLKSHALGRRAGRSKFVQEPPGRHGLHNIKPAPKAGWAIVGDPTGIPRGQLAAVPAKMRFTQSGPQHIAYLQRHDRGSVCKPGILLRFASKRARQSRTTFVATSTRVLVAAAHPCAGAVLQTAHVRKLCAAVDSIARMDDSRPAATRHLTRVPIMLACAATAAACRLAACATAHAARRALFRFGDTTPKSATFFCGPHMAGVAVHIRDG